MSADRHRARPRVTGWPSAFLAVFALFVIPLGLVGYPVMSGRAFELDWMIYAGLALCFPATFAFLWLCLLDERSTS